MSYFRDYIDRINATKKFAREKNVPVWTIPFVNACGILLLTAVYMSVYTWIFVVGIEENMKYVPAWWTWLTAQADWLPMIYFAVLCLTLLDKVLTVIIIIQSSVTKLIYQGILI